MKNRRGQSGLWGYGISGDLPIVLLRIDDQENIELVRQLVQAHAYWRIKGLMVDLVIWNEDDSGYRQTLQDQIMGLIAASPEAPVGGQAGRHLRPAAGADVGRGSHAAADRRACHRRRQGRHAGRPARAPRSSGAACPPIPAGRERPRRDRRRRGDVRGATCSFFNGLGRLHARWT